MNRYDTPKKYFEDFEEKFVFASEVPGLTPQEIKDFAREYDPQLFHLDEEVAANTHFGGLVASGFQTQLKCFLPFCREVLLNSSSVGAPGIDSLKWLQPWYPNKTLDVTVTLTKKRVSSKRNDRGYMNFELAAKADDVVILTMAWASIMLTRQGSAGS